MSRGTLARPDEASPAPSRPRPFLKWAGGKSRLLAQFQPLLPPAGSYARYLEPFLGSAAVFFELAPKVAILADVNREIVDCYDAIRSCPEDVIRELDKHEHDRAHYYEVRDARPRKLAAKAARTIYLNKTGYNGLYRVNRAGRFNVPMGRYDNPGFRSPLLFATLRACSSALAAAEILTADFENVLARARARDFVYLDPPYVPVSPTADFTSYAAGGFGWADQQRLASACKALDRRGVRLMLSNSDTPSVRALYAGFRVDTVLAARSINSKATRRGQVGEVVVRNY
jgi:DNA adenine methylase